MHKAEMDALSGLELVLGLADGFLFSCILFGFFSSPKLASLRRMSFENTSKDFIAPEVACGTDNPRFGQTDKQVT